MKYVPKEIEEEVNVTPVHPLMNFVQLLVTVALIGGAIYWSLGWAADWLALRLSPEMEMKIGQQLLPALVEEAQIAESVQDRRLQYLTELANSLRPSGKLQEIPVKIYILPHEEPNAAILPGGHMLVTEGLLDTSESENELAFVLAHELGHLEARDPLKGLGRSLVFLAASAVVGASTADVGGVPQAVPLTGNLTNLHYSRQQESAADRYALEAVMQRYQHGGNSLDFFVRSQARDWPVEVTGSEYFQTHPLTKKRIATLEALANEKGWPMEGEVTPLPQNFACPNLKPC